jgi:hypothetical protein
VRQADLKSRDFIRKYEEKLAKEGINLEHRTIISQQNEKT